MRALALLTTYLRANFQRDAAYRADFYAQIAVSLLQMTTEIVTARVIFYQTPTLAGWNLYQVLSLLGVYHLVTGFIGTFVAPNMRQLMADVREGTFDFVLLKPASSQFLASIRSLQLWRLTDILLGAGLVLYAVRHMAASVGLLQAAQFVLTLAAGMVIVYSFWLMLSTLCFWFVRIDNLEMIFWNLFEAGRYPLDVYPGWVQRGLTVVVPLAFITTVPARALTGTLTASWLLAALLLAIAMATAASLFWRVALRRYSGASA
jgi:ABC-2 type transport system permease protein